MASIKAHRFEWTRHQPPLNANLTTKFIGLWERVFAYLFKEAEPVLRGMAAKYGSESAKAKLAELDRSRFVMPEESNR